LEGTLQHELVHHEQEMNWGIGAWGGKKAPAETRQLLQDFGWTYDEGSQQYRLLDKKGGQWQRVEDKEGNSKWAPIVDGQPVPERAISSAEMREQAKVKPATDYFTYPWEAHAEAQSMFRHNRQQLWSENKDLYKLMQQYDQREINRRFGTENGQPKMIRGADGDIVPNTPEHRKAVQELERRFATTQLPATQQYAQRDNCCGNCVHA
jgi:hypothetical protein